MFNKAKLRVLRRKKGLTQQDLAREAACDRNTVSRIELGHFCPSGALAQRMAAALEVPVEALYAEPSSLHTAMSAGARGPGDAVAASELGPLSEDELRLVNAMRRMGPVQRAQLVGYALGLESSGNTTIAEAIAKVSGVGESTGLAAHEKEQQRRERA